MTIRTQRLIDRSRMLLHDKCPRARYYEHEWDGTGVVKKGMAIPLATGATVHEGLAALLLGKNVTEAVNITKESYTVITVERGLYVPDGEPSYTAAEQIALAEALVRMWALIGLPALLQQFDVLQVEQELLYPLTPDITLMSRPDAVLRERESGDLYVLSFKTAADFDKRKASELQHDDQGISEVVAIEHALGERVMGVRYEFLMKGRRSEYPKGSGRYAQWSPLIRAYTNEDGELAANYEWVDADGRNRRLGKGWGRVDAWEHFAGGIAEWIEWLAGNDYATLERQLIVPMPCYRNDGELHSWLRQRTRQETAIAWNAGGVEDARTNDHLDFISELDYSFPQNRRSCDYPGPCSFLDICFGPISPSNPLQDGTYVRRRPHHAAELIQHSAIVKGGSDGNHDPGLAPDIAPEPDHSGQGD